MKCIQTHIQVLDYLSFPSIWVPGSSFILASCLIGKEAISSILLDQWIQYSKFYCYPFLLTVDSAEFSKVVLSVFIPIIVSNTIESDKVGSCERAYSRDNFSSKSLF